MDKSKDDDGNGRDKLSLKENFNQMKQRSYSRGSGTIQVNHTTPGRDDVRRYRVDDDRDLVFSRGR